MNMNENDGWTVIRQRASGREKRIRKRKENQIKKKFIHVDSDNNMHTCVSECAVLRFTITMCAFFSAIAVDGFLMH